MYIDIWMYSICVAVWIQYANIWASVAHRCHRQHLPSPPSSHEKEKPDACIVGLKDWFRETSDAEAWAHHKIAHYMWHGSFFCVLRFSWVLLIVFGIFSFCFNPRISSTFSLLGICHVEIKAHGVMSFLSQSLPLFQILKISTDLIFSFDIIPVSKFWSLQYTKDLA